jgi:trehalose 6-phosphate synthase/phosphatase
MSTDTYDYGFGRLHAGASASGAGDYISGGSSGLMGGDGGVEETDFMLAISSDERLLRRLNENDGAETVSTSGKATDARWRIGYDDVRSVLGALTGK